jgi:hypothetical protein
MQFRAGRTRQPDLFIVRGIVGIGKEGREQESEVRSQNSRAGAGHRPSGISDFAFEILNFGL